MKPILIHLFGIIVVFSSCSSAYKIGQTPDDVYYSPAPVQEEYVTTDNQQDKDSYAYNNSDNIEDLAIRRGISDPAFRNNFSLGLGYDYYSYESYGSPFYDPYNSYYNPYSYTGVTFYPYNNYYNSFYSPYSNYYSPYFNSYYPPLYYVTKTGVASNYSGPRQYNLGAYNVNNNRTTESSTTSAPVRSFKPQPTTTGVGGLVRRIFTPSNNNSRSYYRGNSNNDNNYNNNNNNNTTPTRTFQPSNNSGNNSSSGGGGGGSAPVRTFRH